MEEKISPAVEMPDLEEVLEVVVLGKEAQPFREHHYYLREE
mgnify:CR=1 FL=1